MLATMLPVRCDAITSVRSLPLYALARSPCLASAKLVPGRIGTSKPSIVRSAISASGKGSGSAAERFARDGLSHHRDDLVRVAAIEGDIQVAVDGDAAVAAVATTATIRHADRAEVYAMTVVLIGVAGRIEAEQREVEPARRVQRAEPRVVQVFLGSR